MDYGASIVYLLDGDILEAVARCDVYIIQTTALSKMSFPTPMTRSHLDVKTVDSDPVLAPDGWTPPPSNSFG